VTTIPLATLLALGAAVLATSLLAGIFGVAGGMILMGVLLVYMPVPQAMILHGVAQLASNLWRAVIWRRYIDALIVLRYLLGLLVALTVFASVAFVPDRATVLIVLGLVPMLAMVVPDRWAPKVTGRFGAEFAGFSSAGIQLLSGVSGPLLDLFFARTLLDRRCVVATKAACQTFTHLAKLVYFGGLAGLSSVEIDTGLIAMAIVLAVLGTSLGRFVLERLSDVQFRRYTRLLIFAVGVACLSQGINMAIA